ncbi:transporter [Hymenobacter qilianensis]|uniref:Transporter n=1 Tax=Hymenobacter qilianensis TaxID=1385715 RepID=A0ACB5PSD0_9BACT|nr:transporter [Hymenobacter qilianensis]
MGAQGQQRWTLADCLAFAQTHNLQVQQAGLLQDKSVVQQQAAKNAALPTLHARVRTAGNWGFLIDPSTNELSDEFNFGNQAALNFNLNVVNGHATAYQGRLRRDQVAAATYDYQASSNALTVQILNAYLQVLLGQEQLRNAQQREEYAQEQERKVQAQVNKGVLSKRDLLHLQAQVSAESLLRVRAENSVEKALFALAQVVGLPFNESMAVQPVEIPTTWQTTSLATPEALVISATSLPDVKAAQAKVEAAQAAAQLGRALYKPSLALTAQLATRTSNYKPGGFDTQVLDNLNRRVGLALNVPVFNRFQLRTTDQLAKLEVESAKLAYQQVERDLKGKIMGVWLEYRAAAKTYQALAQQYALISEEHRYGAKLLELGGISAVEYSLTRSRLATAQSELVLAKYDCFFKQTLVGFYQGNGLPVGL